MYGRLPTLVIMSELPEPDDVVDLPPSPAPPKARRWWPLLAALGGVVVLAVVAAVAIPRLLPATHHVEGTIVLISSTPNSVTGQWNNCSGQGGYADIAPGASATMRDGEGNIVGTLSTVNLTESRLEELSQTLRPIGFGTTPAQVVESIKKSNAIVSVGCILYFSGEVRDADFYSFSFSKRGELTYSRDDMEKNAWYLQLSIGH